MKFIRSLNEHLAKAENFMMVVFLLSMISLSFTQVVLRNLSLGGIMWGDALVRNLVLWVGFLGGSLATKDDKHIRIDVLTKFLSPMWKARVDFLTSLFSLCIGGVFIWASLRFVISEYESQTVAFLNIPFWVVESIIPIGFGLISLRFFIRLVEDLDKMIKGNS